MGQIYHPRLLRYFASYETKNVDTLKQNSLKSKVNILCNLLPNNRPQLKNIQIKFCRPDLVDWKKVERRQVRERIDTAFHIMEKEYGVTRLLDPEGKMAK